MKRKAAPPAKKVCRTCGFDDVRPEDGNHDALTCRDHLFELLQAERAKVLALETDPRLRPGPEFSVPVYLNKALLEAPGKMRAIQGDPIYFDDPPDGFVPYVAMSHVKAHMDVTQRAGVAMAEAQDKLRIVLANLSPIARWLAWSHNPEPENIPRLAMEAVERMKGPHEDHTEVWRERAIKAEGILNRLKKP